MRDYGSRRIRIDPSVVRGLEYYTGPVFEAQLTFEVPNEKGEPVVFGSVGGGGRYDGLVGRFRGEDVPATGFSVGVSRLASALKAIGKLGDEGAAGPVVVTVMDKERLADYQRIVADLRNAGIAAEMYLGSSGMKAQLKYADRRNAPCRHHRRLERVRGGQAADQGPRRRQGAGGGDRRPPDLARRAPRPVRGGARRGGGEGEGAAFQAASELSGMRLFRTVVMPGLDPGIHSVTALRTSTATEWIAGSSPAMTTEMGANGSRPPRRPLQGSRARARPSPLWGGVGEGCLRPALRSTPLTQTLSPQGGEVPARDR